MYILIGSFFTKYMISAKMKRNPLETALIAKKLS